MDEGYVGYLTWRDCEYCQNYRPIEGGCLLLDKYGCSILDIEDGTDMMKCNKYKEKE